MEFAQSSDFTQSTEDEPHRTQSGLRAPWPGFSLYFPSTTNGPDGSVPFRVRWSLGDSPFDLYKVERKLRFVAEHRGRLHLIVGARCYLVVGRLHIANCGLGLLLLSAPRSRICNVNARLQKDGDSIGCCCMTQIPALRSVFFHLALRIRMVISKRLLSLKLASCG